MFLAFTLLFSSNYSEAGFWGWLSGAAKCLGHEGNASSSAEPILTDGGGGESSLDHPQITVRLKGCLISEINTTRTLTAGQSTSIGGALGHRFIAFIRTSKKVCENKCIMGYKKELAADCQCTSTQITDKTCSPTWAPNVSSVDSTVHNCTVGVGNGFTHCDYLLTKQYVKLCDKYKVGDVEQMVGICAYATKGMNVVNDITDFFKGSSGSLKQKVRQALAHLKGSPGTTLPDEISGMQLLNCYPVPIRPWPPPFCTDGMKVLTPVEVIPICSENETPTLPDGSVSCVKVTGTQSTYNKPCAKVTIKDGSTNPSGTVCQDLTTTTPTLLPLSDGTTIRKFLIAPSVDDDTRVCVKESAVSRGCFKRPDMSKPSVSLCDGSNTNTSDEFCIKISSQLVPKSCSINSTLVPSGDPDDPNGKKFSSTCDSKLGVSFTNKCGSNVGIGGKCIGYNDCCSDIVTSSTKDACDKKAGLYLPLTKDDSPSGITKVCLSGYEPEVTSKDCNVKCNRICATKVSTGTNMSVSTNICQRVKPTKSFGPLTDSENCFLDESTTTGVRGRVPLEDDLCVDMYPFSFDCSKAVGAATTDYSSICSSIKSYCTKPQNSYKCNQEIDKCSGNPGVSSISLGTTSVPCELVKNFPGLSSLSNLDCGKANTPAVTEAQCNTDIKGYCGIRESGADPKHYENFENCIQAYIKCNNNPTGAATLKDGKSFSCSVINAVTKP